MNYYDNVLLVGVGGNGGWLAPILTKAIATNSGIHVDNFYVIDPDVVERKNLLRQNFTKKDIGKSKARVIAERYSELYDFPIKFVSSKITKVLVKEIVRHCPDGACLIIDCTDNIQARLDIESIYQDFIKKRKTVTWISAGVGLTDGYVSFSNSYSLCTPLDFFPSTFNKENALKEKRENERQSCADHAVVETQTVATNNMAATLMYNVISYTDHFNTDKFSNLFLFDLDKGVRSYYISSFEDASIAEQYLIGNVLKEEEINDLQKDFEVK